MGVVHMTTNSRKMAVWRGTLEPLAWHDERCQAVAEITKIEYGDGFT